MSIFMRPGAAANVPPVKARTAVKRTILGLLPLLTLLGATAARAAESDRAPPPPSQRPVEEVATAQKTAAHQMAEAGRARYQEKDYRAAAEDYEAAYKLVPHPDLLFNLALAERALGERGTARRDFERYLASRTALADAASAAADIAYAQKAVVELGGAPVVAPLVTPARLLGPAEAPPPRAWQTSAGYVSLGIAGLLAATGVAAYAIHGHRVDEFNEVQDAPGSADGRCILSAPSAGGGRCSGLLSDANTAHTLSNLGFIGAGLMAVTGGLFLFNAPPADGDHAADARAERARPAGQWRRTTGWVGLGLGAALAATSFGYHENAGSHTDRFNSMRTPDSHALRCSASFSGNGGAACAAELEDAQRSRSISNGTAIGALVSGLLGVTLLVTAPADPDARPAASDRAARTSLACAPTFTRPGAICALTF